MRLTPKALIAAATLAFFPAVLPAQGGIIEPGPTFPVGDSMTCNDMPTPGGACTASTTYTVLEGTAEACEGEEQVQVTVVMTCGSASCTKNRTVCASSSGDISFRCNGQGFTLGLNSGVNYGGMASGISPCSAGSF